MKPRNLFVLLTMFVFLILITACSDASSNTVPGVHQTTKSVEWDPAFVAPECLADKRAPLLEEALENANLDRFTFGFNATNLKESTYYKSGYSLPDEFSSSLSEHGRPRSTASETKFTMPDRSLSTKSPGNGSRFWWFLRTCFITCWDFYCSGPPIS